MNWRAPFLLLSTSFFLIRSHQFFCFVFKLNSKMSRTSNPKIYFNTSWLYIIQRRIGAGHAPFMYYIVYNMLRNPFSRITRWNQSASISAQALHRRALRDLHSSVLAVFMVNWDQVISLLSLIMLVNGWLRSYYSSLSESNLGLQCQIHES